MSIYILRDILCRKERAFGTDALLGITIPCTYELGRRQFHLQMLLGGIACGDYAQNGIALTTSRTTYITDGP